MITKIGIQIPVTYIGRSIRKIVKAKCRYYICIEKKDDSDDVVIVYDYDRVNYIATIPFRINDWDIHIGV